MHRVEQAIHRQIVAGLRVALPASWIVAHVPNGGKRTKVEGAIFRALGVVPGMPDIMILGDAESGATAWFFEVKASDKSPLSGSQKVTHDRLRELGFACEVVCSWDQALRWARHWRLPLRLANGDST